MFAFENEVEIPLAELQEQIVAGLNKEIFSYTEFKIVLENNDVKLVKKEEVKPIGEGYFAKVYPLVIDNKKYAKKKLKSEFINDREVAHRFKREYQIMQSLNASEFTISVYDFDENEKSFTMEYAEKTLKDFIHENYHIMNIEWKEHLCERVILGLMELHKTTLHRDLSYNNILMVNNVPKLADFGLGKDLTKDYSYKTVSESNVGTPHFTDPIQHINIKNASIQTDIYSLGKIIDFIFCGSIVSHEHKYSSLVTKATHKDLNKRYKTVEELHEAFRTIRDSNIDFDPVLEIEKMSEEKRISTEKLYRYFTGPDGGTILLNLLLRNKQVASEILELYSFQYEHELETLISKLFMELKDMRLDFSQYDRFGQMAMELLVNLDHQATLMFILADIIDYCADDINRFNIQNLRKQNKNNPKIPYEIRKRWAQL